MTSGPLCVVAGTDMKRVRKKTSGRQRKPQHINKPSDGGAGGEWRGGGVLLVYF